MNNRERKLKSIAKSIGANKGPSYWPESEEELDLRKLRAKLDKTKVEVGNEMFNQGADIAQILEEIHYNLRFNISLIDDMIGSDGNDV